MSVQFLLLAKTHNRQILRKWISILLLDVDGKCIQAIKDDCNLLAMLRF